MLQAFISSPRVRTLQEQHPRIMAVAAADMNRAFGLKLGAPPAAPSMHSGTTPRSASHVFLDPKERYGYGGRTPRRTHHV